MRFSLSLSQPCIAMHCKRNALQTQCVERMRTVQEGQARCEAGQLGRVLTRGLHVTPGYWNDAAATRAALSPSGWLDTGDLGYLDAAGHLWLCGRSKDMIKSGGENVHASDVERALSQVPGVHASAVVGLPDERWGEAVSALLHVSCFVTFHKGVLEWGGARGYSAWDLPDDRGAWSGVRRVASKAEAAFVLHVCKDAGLARFKHPGLIVLQSEPIPSTSTGKLLKAQVKRLLLAVVARTRSRL